MDKPMPILTPPRRQHGFTLIEVLITVVVLAIGLLGLAGLQLNGLRFTHSAYQTSQATIAAYDIIDRMRVNRLAAESGSYDIALGATPTAANCSGTGVNCSPATLASADLTEWKQSIAALLPSGDGAVQRNGSAFLVTIRWDDSRGENDPKELTVETVL
ncbi:MAG: type IV pilus modification protein PilV [Gammaproteobacteria bacterium]|nr:type IV pilus modification protein PilV [Gammaproteobacteria bacterium]